MLISRTITYGLVTAALVGIYVATVVALGALIGRSSTLVTAGATLAVATAFHPVRQRAQSVVDRRFDRARFDASPSYRSFHRGPARRPCRTRTGGGSAARRDR